MISDELLPCPFCGQKDGHDKQGDRTLATDVYAHDFMYSTVCSGCGAEGPKADTKEKAQDKWDTRPD